MTYRYEGRKRKTLALYKQMFSDVMAFSGTNTKLRHVDVDSQCAIT